MELLAESEARRLHTRAALLPRRRLTTIARCITGAGPSHLNPVEAEAVQAHRSAVRQIRDAGHADILDEEQEGIVSLLVGSAGSANDDVLVVMSEALAA